MKVILDRDALVDNIIQCNNFCRDKNVDVSFMLKSYFLRDDFLRELFAKQKTYTTCSCNGFLKYDSVCFVADLLEKREGLDKAYFAHHYGNGEYAILNCYCASEKLPTEAELKCAIDFLHENGYVVSAGGTVIGYYDNNDYDELRIGEGVLTGYSTVVKKNFIGCTNPFTIEMDIEQLKDDFVLVNHGFLELGGFTDTKPLFVNTDLSGFDIKTARTGKVVVHPDYYTLIKLFAGGIDVEYK